MAADPRSSSRIGAGRWVEPLARLAAAAAVLAAVLWFSPGAGLPLDDAWIHQVVARTFAETGTLGYAPGQHGAAATSYLWAALLAVNFAIVHIAPETWALLLNCAAAVASVDLLYRILSRARPDEELSPPAWRAIILLVSLGGSVSANMLWFVCSGMESMPLVALSLGAIEVASAVGPIAWRRGLVVGTLAGLLALLRPEAIVLGPLLFAYLVARHWRSRRRAIGSVVAATSPWLLAVLVYVGSNQAKTGHMVPSTLAGRRWLWFSSTEGLQWSSRLVVFLDEWAKRLGTYTLDTSLAVAWVLVGIAFYGGVRLFRSRGRAGDGARLLLGWAVVHGAFYALMLPTPGHGGRYQPLVPLLFATLVPIGAMLAITRLVGLVRPAAARAGILLYGLAVLVPLAAMGASVAVKLRRANALAVDHIRATEIAAGRFVATLPAGAVASFDIGGVGIAAGRPILDLGGLSDADTAMLLANGRIAEWITRREVRWIVLPDGAEPVLPVFDSYVRRLNLGDRADLRLVPIRVFETPFPEWAPAIAATWNAARRQIVYRVERSAVAAGSNAVPVPETARRPIADPAGLVPGVDRQIAEHMLAVLAARGIEASIAVTSNAEPSTSAPCLLRVGHWGLAVDGCAALDPAVVRTTAWEWAGRYLEVGDLGGAVRALPHVLVAARQRIDPAFSRSLPPLTPLAPPGAPPAANGIATTGIWLLGVTLLTLLLLDLAARRKVGLRAAVVCLSLVGCSRSPNTLEAAMTRGRGAVLDAVDRGIAVEPASATGASPLFAATARGDLEIVSLLLARGARADRRAVDGTFPLHIAVRHGHAAVAATLLGASLEGLDAPAGRRRRVPLEDAVAVASVDATRVLLASGANPNASDAFGQMSLHLLATVDPPQAVELASLLLAAGARPDRVDARGFTALHGAAFGNAASLLRVLVREDGDALEARTPSGDSALDVAIRYGKAEAAEVLVAAGAVLPGDAMPPLHEAARLDDITTTASLLAMGADVHRLHHGKTALAVAEEAGSARAATLLRERDR